MPTPARSILLALLVVLLATACGSRPRKTLKYRKKRGCDCPSWGQLRPPVDDSLAFPGPQLGEPS